MLHGMPEIEDFATPDKPCGPVPDPLRSVADDDYRGTGAEPAQFAQLSIQPVEDIIGITQTTDQKAPHYRAPSGRRFDSFLRQQQDASLDLAEMALLNGRQWRQWLRTRLSPPRAAHLHAQRAAIHAQQNSGRSLAGDSAFAAAIGVIPAQPFAVSRNCLSQPLRHFPDRSLGPRARD